MCAQRIAFLLLLRLSPFFLEKQKHSYRQELWRLCWCEKRKQRKSVIFFFPFLHYAFAREVLPRNVSGRSGSLSQCSARLARVCIFRLPFVSRTNILLNLWPHRTHRAIRDVGFRFQIFANVDTSEQTAIWRFVWASIKLASRDLRKWSEDSDLLFLSSGRRRGKAIATQYAKETQTSDERKNIEFCFILIAANTEMTSTLCDRWQTKFSLSPPKYHI